MGSVSVPLRGKGRDQLPLMLSFGQLPPRRFPSPCGEKVGINKDRKAYLAPPDFLEFPSPCGEKVGINPTLGKA